jgi:CRP-like cAMP-binding protein
MPIFRLNLSAMPTSGFPIEKFHFKSNSLLDDLPKKDLEILHSSMTFKKLKKGQSIFIEGAYPAGVFYLKKGRVKKYKADKDGREQIIYVCNSGELFGYPALLSAETYSDSAASMEDSVVGFIGKDVFLKLVEQSPAFSAGLLKNLSHEFGVLENTIASFAHKSVRERLALSLLILKEKFRVKGTDGDRVEITMSREDLSNIVGTAVETLVRLLHDFKEEGLIETQGRKIIVINAKVLVKIANLY